MNQKGFALLEILIVVAIVVLLGGGGLYLKNLTNQQNTLTVGNDAIKQATQEQQQAQTQSAQALLIEASSTLGSKTYLNSRYGFGFQYPDAWEVRDDLYGNSTSSYILSLVQKKAPNPYEPPIIIHIATPDFVSGTYSNLKAAITSTTTITVAGVVGTQYEYRFDGEPMVDIALPFGNYGMILGADRNYKTVFDGILATFIFTSTTATEGSSQ